MRFCGVQRFTGEEAENGACRQNVWTIRSFFSPTTPHPFFQAKTHEVVPFVIYAPATHIFLKFGNSALEQYLPYTEIHILSLERLGASESTVSSISSIFEHSVFGCRLSAELVLIASELVILVLVGFTCRSFPVELNLQNSGRGQGSNVSRAILEQLQRRLSYNVPTDFNVQAVDFDIRIHNTK